MNLIIKLVNVGVLNPKYIYLYFKITSVIFSYNANSLGNPGQLEYDLVSQLDITPLRAAFKCLILALRIPRPSHVQDDLFQFLMCYLVGVFVDCPLQGLICWPPSIIFTFRVVIDNIPICSSQCHFCTFSSWISVQYCSADVK